MFAEIIYGISGFLLANGMVHLLTGAGGLFFRSPFGRYSRPKVNILWALTSSLLFPILLIEWRLSVEPVTNQQLTSLLIGVSFCYAFFAVMAKHFLDYRPSSQKKPKA